MRIDLLKGGSSALGAEEGWGNTRCCDVVRARLSYISGALAPCCPAQPEVQREEATYIHPLYILVLRNHDRDGCSIKRMDRLRML